MRPLLPLLLILAAATPAAAQTPSTAPEFAHPVIVVTGAGRASRPADYAEMTVSFRGDGATQLDALRALTAVQERVSQGVSRLEGVRRHQVRSGASYVRESFPPDCERLVNGDRVRPRGDCAPTGFVASLSDVVRVWPAERVGAAMSIAAERGAVAVGLGDSGVDDPAALRRLAVDQAVRQARSQAEAIARASGVALGSLERIVDPEARYGATSVDYLPEIPPLSGSRVVPAVALNVSPPPIRQDVRVTVVFRIGR